MMTPDADFSLELADRLASKRLPRTTSILVVTAGLMTATLLILAAGNARIDTFASGPVEEAALRKETATNARKAAHGSTYGAAVSAMRGTVDLAAHRLERSANMN